MSTDKARRGRPKGSGLDDRMHLEAMRGLIAKDPSLKPTTAIKMLGITDPSAIRRLRDKFKDVGVGGEPLDHVTDVSAPHRESLDTVKALPQSLIAVQAIDDRADMSTAVLERAPHAKLPSEAASDRGLRLVSSGPGPVAAPVISSAPPAAALEIERRAEATKATPPPEPAAMGAPEEKPASSAKPANVKSGPSGKTSNSSTPRSQKEEAATLLVRWYAFGVTACFATAEAQMKVMESVLKTPAVSLAVKQQLMFCELAKAFLSGGTKTPRR